MLVVLVAAATSTGIAFATRQYTESMETSQSVVLMSTLKSSISNELAITRYAELGEGADDGSREVVRFFSTNYGTKSGYSEFKLLNENGGFGELALGSGDVSSTWKKLVSSKSYPEGIGARVEVRYHDSSGADPIVPARFEVKLAVGNAGQGTLLEEDFEVVPYNVVNTFDAA